MSTLMRQDRPSLTELFWSGWPFGAMAWSSLSRT